MQLKCFALVLFASMLYYGQASANGGPVEESYLRSTGQIKPLAKKDITLKKEILTIKLQGDYAYVDVLYTFFNKGKEDKVSYAFPVDMYADLEGYSGGSEPALTSLQIEDEDGLLSTKKLPQESYLLKLEEKDMYYGEIDTMKIIRQWYATETTFLANKEKTLLVSYKVHNNFSDWGTSKSFFTSYDLRNFLYEFSMAGNWGNGVVEDMQIIIDERALLDSSASISGISMAGFQSAGGIYSRSMRNVDMKSLKPLRIEYDNSAGRMLAMANKYRVPDSWINSISASSTLAGGSYVAKNLLDGKLSTAWVEGAKGTGENEKIEIQLVPNEKHRIMALMIANGYQKSDESFAANSMPIRIKIEYFSDDPSLKNDSDLKADTFTLKVSKMPQPLTDWGEVGYNIDRIVITILDTEKGRKYEDCCISELYLLSYIEE